MERREGDFLLTDDKAMLRLESVIDLLRQTYWAVDRPRETVARSIETSLCFSVHHEGRQIGFARVVSDYAVYSLILDVIIDEKYRGQGLGKSLMGFINKHPALAGTHKALWTRNAVGFYTPLGFKKEEEMFLMIKRVP